MPALFVKVQETFLTHRCRKIWLGFNQDLFLTHRGVHQHISSQRLCDLNFRLDRICCLLAIDLYLVRTNRNLNKKNSNLQHTKKILQGFSNLRSSISEPISKNEFEVDKAQEECQKQYRNLI